MAEGTRVGSAREPQLKQAGTRPSPGADELRGSLPEPHGKGAGQVSSSPGEKLQTWEVMSAKPGVQPWEP